MRDVRIILLTQRTIALDSTAESVDLIRYLCWASDICPFVCSALPLSSCRVFSPRALCAVYVLSAGSVDLLIRRQTNDK